MPRLNEAALAQVTSPPPPAPATILEWTTNATYKSADITLSNSNHRATSVSGATAGVYAQLAADITTGKWCYAFQILSGTDQDIGWSVKTLVDTATDPGLVGNGITWYAGDGQVYSNGGAVGDAGVPTIGSAIHVMAINLTDFSPGKFWIWNASAAKWNNAAIGSQNPEANVGGISLPNTSAWTPHFYSFANGSAVEFVAMPFSLSGYTPLGSV